MINLFVVISSMIYIIVTGFVKKINIVRYDGWGFVERGWDKAICPNMSGGVGWELNRTTTMWDKEEAPSFLPSKIILEEF